MVDANIKPTYKTAIIHLSETFRYITLVKMDQQLPLQKLHNNERLCNERPCYVQPFFLSTGTSNVINFANIWFPFYRISKNPNSNNKHFLTDITIKIKKNNDTSSILPFISNSNSVLNIFKQKDV